MVMYWCLHCGGDVLVFTTGVAGVYDCVVLVFMTVVLMWWCWCSCCAGVYVVMVIC